MSVCLPAFGAFCTDGVLLWLKVRTGGALCGVLPCVRHRRRRWCWRRLTLSVPHHFTLLSFCALSCALYRCGGGCFWRLRCFGPPTLVPAVLGPDAGMTLPHCWHAGVTHVSIGAVSAGLACVESASTCAVSTGVQGRAAWPAWEGWSEGCAVAGRTAASSPWYYMLAACNKLVTSPKDCVLPAHKHVVEDAMQVSN